MNKELAVYTLFSQAMVNQKFAEFYISKLVPDLLDHYATTCGKSAYFAHWAKVPLALQRSYKKGCPPSYWLSEKG